MVWSPKRTPERDVKRIYEWIPNRKPVGRPGTRWKDNIRIILTSEEVDFEEVDGLCEDRVAWQNESKVSQRTNVHSLHAFGKKKTQRFQKLALRKPTCYIVLLEKATLTRVFRYSPQSQPSWTWVLKFVRNQPTPCVRITGLTFCFMNTRLPS